MIMLEFGLYADDSQQVLIRGYDFVSTPQGVQLLFTGPQRSLKELSDTSRAVTEPSVLLMLSAGLALVRQRARGAEAKSEGVRIRLGALG